MEKRCLIVMPGSDPDGYSKGHFDRVYQYIVAPACKTAGFSPVKANEPRLNETSWDMVKGIVESEIVICDLSAKDPNAVYAFTIRHAMNLPVCLIKDARTIVKFDIKEYGTVEYDESLRIDTVQNASENLGNGLVRTFASKRVNELLSRFDIGTAPTEESGATESAEEHKKEEPRLPVISPVPNYVGDLITQFEEIDRLKVGDSVFHINYGKGEITSLNKMAKDKVAKVQFESGSKLLVLSPSGILRKIKG